MIHLVMPLGTTHGWGVCGRMIAREMVKIEPVELYTQAMKPDLLEDELEWRAIRELLPKGVDPMNPPVSANLNGPVLHGMPALEGDYWPGIRGTFNVGYTFFENDREARKHAKRISDRYDVVAAGSTWCADALRAAGLENVEVVLQGIEPRRFNSNHSEKQFFRDRFVVFSGGKLEFRKGQDIVIRAYQVLQDRHKDVMLINAWFNAWPESSATISASPLLKLPRLGGEFSQVVNSLLAANGIDVSRVITLGARNNTTMPDLYRNTDVGVFPNRCEGGTNLVLMEYMACGKPALAAMNTGHKDVLTERNSIPIMTNATLPVVRDEKEAPIAEWFEPSLEETIEKLEWAYQNRDMLREIGTHAAEDLSKMTWAETARQFHKILKRA